SRMTQAMSAAAAGLMLATAAGSGTAVAQERTVDDAALTAAPAPGEEWPSHGRDDAETRFSPLAGIHAGNVERLGLAWYHDTGAVRGHEATPLVADGVLYASTPWSNVFA